MSTLKEKGAKFPGSIAWMVYNKVTPNLLMLVLLIGGFLVSKTIKQEVFPEFDLDIVNVSVVYSGASPEEIEKGIILAIEENIQGLTGISEYTSTASEGMASVSIELLTGANRQQVFQDIKQEVDRISTFPDDAEDPVVTLVARKSNVLQVTLYGDVSDHALRELAEHTRDRLLQDKEISQVNILGGRDFEVSVDISQQTLRTYGLSLSDVAARIKAASIELPGGKIRTSGGEILLRLKDRSDWAKEFARIPIITTASGSIVYLEDIAQVHENFEDSNMYATFNGKKSLGLDVVRIGAQTPIGVADATRAAMAEIEADFPPTIGWEISRDRSVLYQQRLDLLLKNAFLGLILVLILLGTFLEFRLACWVTMGIPISFLGGLIFLPSFGISINMLSMFAFIVALGIVVDDAIIAGENIYEYRERGHSFLEAAIMGARDVAMPITFAILTNIVAFAPLLFVPGVMGQIYRVIPIVVISVFALSWIEAIFILPSHLAHGKDRKATGIFRLIERHNTYFTKLLYRFINNIYGPFLAFSLRWRGLAVATGVAILIISIGYIKSGRISFILMPRVESDRSVVTATFPLGTPMVEIDLARTKLEKSIRKVADDLNHPEIVTGIFSRVNENEVEVNAYLAPPEVRILSTKELTAKWRQATGNISGTNSVLYESDRGGPGSGSALSIEISHRNISTLEQASNDLANSLEAFSSTKDVDSGFSLGKQQFDFHVNATGKALGLSNTDIGRQMRNSFEGALALKQQRGRNEMTVRVRLPESERISEFNIEQLMVQTANNTYVPLMEVADIERSRAYTTITRRDGRRVVTVSSNVDPIGAITLVTENLNSTILPELAKKYPGLSYSYQGRQADRKETMLGILDGFVFALLAIYVLLAIPFKSYIQPVIVMFAIPFGLVGALAGHVLMGYNLSTMSMMGLLALSGVIVNDSLVLVDYANKKIADGLSPYAAIHRAGMRRFRPIMLTTLTTFGGLAPMMFETSRQARFMIPMALSLGFGILFVTVIALLLVPCFFMLIEDVKALGKSLMS